MSFGIIYIYIYILQLCRWIMTIFALCTYTTIAICTSLCNNVMLDIILEYYKFHLKISRDFYIIMSKKAKETCGDWSALWITLQGIYDL